MKVIQLENLTKLFKRVDSRLGIHWFIMMRTKNSNEVLDNHIDSSIVHVRVVARLGKICDLRPDF